MVLSNLTFIILEYLKIENLKKLSRDWSLQQKVRKQGIIFWLKIFYKFNPYFWPITVG